MHLFKNAQRTLQYFWLMCACAQIVLKISNTLSKRNIIKENCDDKEYSISRLPNNALRRSQIVDEVDGIRPMQDNLINSKQDYRVKSGRRISEMEIDFGKSTLSNQAYKLILTGEDLDTDQIKPGYALAFTLSGGVDVTTAGCWYRRATIEGHDKAESGTYSVYNEISEETTQELVLGMEASVTISAAPLGVGADATVGASASYSMSLAKGTSSGSSATMELSVDKGQGGQGWSRGGWITAEFDLDKSTLGKYQKGFEFITPAEPVPMSISELGGAYTILTTTTYPTIKIKKVYGLVDRELCNTYYKLP